MSVCNTNNLILLFLDRKDRIKQNGLISIRLIRYRKYNLAIFENGVQIPSTVDVVSFDTDFGVTFGVFICFDIFFNQPLQSLLKQGVRHFVFPAFWPNELPFLTGESMEMKRLLL